MPSDGTIIAAFEEWFRVLCESEGDPPPRGAVAAALVVLDRVKASGELRFEHHLTKRGGQIAGMGGNALRAVLSRHGEQREYLKEGGRTNRGNHRAVSSMLDSLQSSGLGALPAELRASTIDHLQRILIDRAVQRWFEQQRLSFAYDSTRPVSYIVSEILTNAKARKQDGYVAQHLVGAKLELRHAGDGLKVANYPGSAGDAQSDRPGDFYIGNTAFHVTVRPSERTLVRCQGNLDAGVASVLLVPDNLLAGAKQLAQVGEVATRISIYSIEAFVGQNISEVGGWSHASQAEELASLIAIYNRRVSEVESDRSLMLEIPDALRRL